MTVGMIEDRLLYMLLFALVVLLLVSAHIRERFVDYKTKCFSCEAQFPAGLGWMGQPTKCFSCEADLVKRTGDPTMGYEAHPMKYY